MPMPLQIGVLGAGHLGKIHLRCIAASPEAYTLVGFYDADATQAAKVEKDLGVKAFSSVEDLIAACDVVDIVTPTVTHFALAKQVLLAKKHLFIEKPLTNTVEEGRELVALAQQMGVKVQVGHVERFNPAFLALHGTPLAPMFVEAHRLATFNPRGTDVSVVLDLMIHDIDIVLHLVNSPVREIRASGVSIVSQASDIVNARIEFESGCVANLTASRLSLKQMRKVRLFQPDAYISLDFLDKKAEIVRLLAEKEATEHPLYENLMTLDTAHGKRWLTMEAPEPEPVNAIQLELQTFAQSIHADTTPTVNIEAGFAALEVAHRIMAACAQSAQWEAH